MTDNIKYYGQPSWRYLKNVVYKNRTNGEIIIAGIRGDLEVNKIKLEHLLNAVGQLDEAEEKDLQKLGTKPGYVHSWGHKGVKYAADESLKTVINFIGGQKEAKTDSINVNPGGFLAIISSGNITIDGTVTNVEGVYVANGIISSGTSNSQLIGEGIFTGWGGIDLTGRDFNSTQNNTDPAARFIYRPDLVRNAYKYLMQPKIAWQEVAP